MSTDTLSYVIGVVGLLGVIFTVYKYFRDPQIKADKTDTILDYRISSLEASIKKMLSNDLPHLDAKLADVHSDISELKIGLAKLVTIIDERIPRK